MYACICVALTGSADLSRATRTSTMSGCVIGERNVTFRRYTQPVSAQLIDGCSAQEDSFMRALMAIGLAAALAVGVKAQTTELKVGDAAPDFNLQASDGKAYKLSDFKGKKAVVLAWFPKAFTQGCTIECKSLAENVDKKEADFPLLADPNKEVATKYGVLMPAGLANRWTFYIDKNGKISYIEKM